MATFAYEAMNQGGQAVKDEIEADSLVEAINEAAPWTVCVERPEKGRLWTATIHE